jgi:hypothetical protein
VSPDLFLHLGYKPSRYPCSCLHLLILYSNVKSFVTASYALGYVISRLRRWGSYDVSNDFQR